MTESANLVVLVQTQRHFRRGNVWRLVNRCLPPLGLASLAAVLEQNHVPVRILDTVALGLSPQEAVKEIEACRPRWVGITATTVEINDALCLAGAIKAAAPETQILFGGAHPTAMPEEVAAHPAVHAVVCGEGEDTLLELIQNERLSEVRGIAFRDDSGRVVLTPPRPAIENLDRLPMPAYHLLPMRHYRPSLGNFKRLPAISMVTTRGCPGRCTFCSTKGMGQRVRSRSAVLLADEIAWLNREYGIREISFYDDTISCHKKNFLALLEELIRRKLDITWSCMSRVDMVDLDMLKLMKRAGCHQVAYGIESASPAILQNVKKHLDLDRAARVADETKRAGLDLRLMFMFGNPGETLQTMKDTLALALRLNPDLFVFNITVPFPGTEMYGWAKNEGRLLAENWDQYDLSRVILRLDGLSPEQITGFYQYAYRKAYFRPGFILKWALKALRPGELRAMLSNVGFFAKALWGAGSHSHFGRSSA